MDPANDILSCQRASKNLYNLGQPVNNANGSAGDSGGVVYMQDAINMYDTTLQAELYMKDSR